MGVIKPRPSGEVAAQLVALRRGLLFARSVARLCLAHRKVAFLAGLCPAPARKLFEKSLLDLQKLLKMSMVYHYYGGAM